MIKPPHLLYRWLAHAQGRRHTRGALWQASLPEGSDETGDGKQLTLADLRISERALVVRLCGGRFVIQRLAALGFTPGAAVEVAQNYGWGPLIVSTRGARVALGRGEARQLIVERKPL